MKIKTCIRSKTWGTQYQTIMILGKVEVYKIQKNKTKRWKTVTVLKCKLSQKKKKRPHDQLEQAIK